MHGYRCVCAFTAIALQGTGIAIYFPNAAASLNKEYASMVASDPAALTGWRGFLGALYNATSAYTANPALGDFRFVDTYAVPYMAISSGSWITHGSLSNAMGLTATLLYGFRAPSGVEFITAGSMEAHIVETCATMLWHACAHVSLQLCTFAQQNGSVQTVSACCVQCNGCCDHSFREPILRSSAVGSWTGFLFGLVQDLSHGDSMVDALALAHAQEQRILDAQGRISQLILQVKVRFAATSIKLCAFSHTSTPAAWPSRHFMRQAAHQQHLT